jgi:hypothetical protein
MRFAGCDFRHLSVKNSVYAPSPAFRHFPPTQRSRSNTALGKLAFLSYGERRLSQSPNHAGDHIQATYLTSTNNRISC